MSANTTTETKRQRGRKVAAVLAGGLVLGVGTMATLASWNDAEFAQVTYKAGTFNLEGAVDAAQTSFTEHSTKGAAGSLLFTTTVGGNMQPGDEVYAPYALRLGKDTTYGATVAISAEDASVVTKGLTYTVFTTATAGCSASSTSTGVVVPAGTPLNSVGASNTFAVAKPATAGSAGTPTYLCFKVTAVTTGQVMDQAQTSSPVWKFTATSGAS